MNLCQTLPTGSGAGHRGQPPPASPTLKLVPAGRACRMGRISPGPLRDSVKGLELVARQFHHVVIAPDLVTSAGQSGRGDGLEGLGRDPTCCSPVADHGRPGLSRAIDSSLRRRRLSGSLPSRTRRHGMSSVPSKPASINSRGYRASQAVRSRSAARRSQRSGARRRK